MRYLSARITLREENLRQVNCTRSREYILYPGFMIESGILLFSITCQPFFLPSWPTSSEILCKFACQDIIGRVATQVIPSLCLPSTITQISHFDENIFQNRYSTCNCRNVLFMCNNVLHQSGHQYSLARSNSNPTERDILCRRNDQRPKAGFPDIHL